MRASVASHAFFLLAISSLAFCAANDSSPPTIPTGEGIVFSRAIFSNGTPAAGEPLIILATSSSSQMVFRLIADSSGGFVLTLDPAQYELDAIIDYPHTPGIDFASTTVVNAKAAPNATFIFYSAGSVSGEVTIQGKPASNATVKASCPSPAFDYGRINGGKSVMAGEAGEFIFKALPGGNCLISAHDGLDAKSVEVQVVGGASKPVAIELSETPKPAPSLPSVPQQAGVPLEFLVAALALVMVAAYLLSGKKGETKAISAEGADANAAKGKKPHKSAAPAKSKKATLPAVHFPQAAHAKPGSIDAQSEKAKAVLHTLSEREAEIARFLLSSGGKALRSSIQHKLLIPKTSLLRNLRSLERKNIVKLTPFGRNLLAELNRELFE